MASSNSPRKYINRAVVRKSVREERARRMRDMGRTRWGQSWLGALHAVDKDNRLGRGLEYARQGAVTGIEFRKAGQNYATVAGSRPQDYRVQLSLKPFTEQQTSALLAEIARRPEWLDSLLCGQFPSGLEQVLTDTNVEVFAKSWRDIGMHCSCPDDATPCKHIAATLYRLAQYIDEDPTLLFTIRGLDLNQQLKQLGQAEGLSAPSLADLMEPVSDSSTLPSPVDPHQSQPLVESLALQHSLIPLWKQLLPARPSLFQGGDLSSLYERYLTAASAFWARPHLDDEEDDTTQVAMFAEVPVQPWFVASARIVLDAGGGFAKAELIGHAGDVVHTFSKEVGLLGYAERRDCPVAVLQYAYRLAHQLVVRGAVVPRLLHLGGDEYRVRWQAAMQEPRVSNAVAQLAESPGLLALLRYRISDAVEESEDAYRQRLGAEVAAELEGSPLPKSTPAYRYEAPIPADAVHALLGVFMRPMLLAGVGEVLAKAEHSVVQLLFLGRPVSLANEGDAHTAEALQLWLRRLDAASGRHRLLVQVDEVDGRPGAFSLRLLVTLEGEATPEPLPVQQLLAGEHGESLRLAVLRDVALLGEAYAPFSAFAKTSSTPIDSIPLRGGDFAEFLFSVVPALQLSGTQLLLPHGLDQAARPQLSAVLRGAGQGENGEEGVGGEPAGKRAPGLLGLKALVSFDWQVAVGAQQVSSDEFRALAESYEGIVRLRDGFVWLDPTQIARLLRRLDAPPQPAAHVVLQSVLTEEFQGNPISLSAEVRRLREELLEQPASPAQTDLHQLNATLRPYQEVGFAWLLRNADAGLGSLLADDMGLGKTLQTIALLEHYRTLNRWEGAPALIILPTSLITNWQRELARFAPELRVVVYHGPGRKLRVFAKADVILTSYGVVRSAAAKLAKRTFGALIIDEAQQIKNPGAAQTEAVKSLDAPIRIALSGTPVENRLAEYWSVLDFVNPGYLGPLPQFTATYADPIERDRDAHALERFRQVTAPFLLRRLKTDRSVIADLPEKITQIESCDLVPEQAALYQQVVDTQLAELAAAEPHERRGRMLKFMTAVKQVCNHPHHYLKRGTRAPAASGKSLRLLELVDAALASEERVLIFTQYRQMGELLVEMLEHKLGYAPPFLHGGLSRDERDAMVVGMQEGSGPPILLLSIKAGGTGLNLTAANHVIHYDLWWNPAVESQATDRAFRIGQQRNVHVHRLISTGTFEERIDLMLSQKRELADLTVGEGGEWLGDLSVFN